MAWWAWLSLGILIGLFLASTALAGLIARGWR